MRSPGGLCLHSLSQCTAARCWGQWGSGGAPCPAPLSASSVCTQQASHCLFSHLSLPLSKRCDFPPGSMRIPRAGGGIRARGIWVPAGTKPAPGSTRPDAAATKTNTKPSTKYWREPGGCWRFASGFITSVFHLARWL